MQENTRAVIGIVTYKAFESTMFNAIIYIEIITQTGEAMQLWGFGFSARRFNAFVDVHNTYSFLLDRNPKNRDQWRITSVRKA